MPHRYPELQTPEWLQREYRDKVRTIVELASDLNCTETAILRAMKRFGVPSRTAVESRQLRGTAGRKLIYPKLGQADWLREQYIDKGRSQEEIAAEVGCTTGAVFKSMRKFGIEQRMPGRIRTWHRRASATPELQDREWLYEQRVVRQWSTKAIARKLGCSEYAVTKSLWRHNVQLRPNLPRGKDYETAAPRILHKGGYVFVWSPNHPQQSRKGYVGQHRLVAEAELGRFLLPREVVHHLNINPGDNRVDNFIVFPSNAIHMSFHANPSTWVPRCKCCGKPNPESMTGRPANVPLLYTDWPDVLKP